LEHISKTIIFAAENDQIRELLYYLFINQTEDMKAYLLIALLVCGALLLFWTNQKQKAQTAQQNVQKIDTITDFKHMATPLKQEQFIQITIVVDDIRRAAKAWAAVLDIPEPEIWVNHLQSNGEYPYTYRGKESPCDLQMCVSITSASRWAMLATRSSRS
jgi:hypothetical protein